MEVCLWSAFPEQTKELSEHRENRRFLPGVELPESMNFSADPATAADGAELAVNVVPTQHVRAVAERPQDLEGHILEARRRGFGRGDL